MEGDGEGSLVQGEKSLVQNATTNESAQISNTEHSPIDDKMKCLSIDIEISKQGFEKLMSKEELAFYEKLFRIANIAQDGRLNDTELMLFLDQHNYVISKNEARQIVKAADSDKSGFLNFKEFLTLCKKSGVNLTEIGLFEESGEKQLQNSLKIRNLFRQIVASIELVPNIQETVEYFENKIAEVSNASSTSFNISSKGFSLYDNQYSDENIFNLNFDFDLIVIGNGSGGNAVANEAAKIGKRVAICDPNGNMDSINLKKFGESCVNVGCVPKMLMNFAGQIGEVIDYKNSAPFGWFAPENNLQGTAEGNTPKAFKNHDWSKLVTNIQNHIRVLNFERQYSLKSYKGIQYYACQCEFDGPHKIKLSHEDQTTEFITGEKIVIAVGSTYCSLEIPGADGNCITVDDIFSLKSHPGRVLIVGEGPDALECAGLLCRLDVNEVAIMSKSPVLRGFDRRMVTLILETLHCRGVKIMIGWTPEEIISENSANGKKLTVISKHLQTGEKSSKEFDTIVLAIGKKHSTDLLKLDKAEILMDEQSHKIWVDSQDMTTVEHVYALGDCASHRSSDTSVAYQAGINLSRRLYHSQKDGVDSFEPAPKFLVTPVQYACVGLSEEGAGAEYGEHNINIYHSRFHPLQYQLENRHKDVYYSKMITLKPESERIIGLHYLGPNAGEIMQGFVLALKLRATKSDVDSMLSIHPTCAEIFSRMTKSSEESAHFVLSHSSCC